MKAFFDSIKEQALEMLPSLTVIMLILLLLFLVRRLVRKHFANTSGKRYQHQLVMIAVYLLALLTIVIALPVSDELRGQLLSLISIVLSATIALSSTTFVGNAMAGIMLRTLRHFHVGDFLRVGEYFGRVTETGLLHVEIQTEDRDLMTIPNLYLVSNPTRVILSNGTIISAQVSLGYDTPWQDIETALLKAAEQAGLEDAFVQLVSLGDFSITYQISGLLSEVKQYISTRSNLRKAMLDTLHRAKIEIVSPTFMNTRAYSKDDKIIPKVVTTHKAVDTTVSSSPEEVVFDIAEEAESLEKLKEKHDLFAQQMDELKHASKGMEDKEKTRALYRIAYLEELIKRLSEVIKQREEEANPPTP